MASNGMNGLMQGPMPNGGYGGFGAVTKGPILDRYHSTGEEHGWTKAKGGKKNNIALSALTLLAFLFFLNILQNCMQDHMDEHKGKGKGYGHSHYPQVIQSQYPFQWQFPTYPGGVQTFGRAELRKNSEEKKGETGDFTSDASDNSLEIDNLSADQADERIYSNSKVLNRRENSKRKEDTDKTLMEKINTLHNLDTEN